jgi:hypothetical protein
VRPYYEDDAVTQEVLGLDFGASDGADRGSMGLSPESARIQQRYILPTLTA